MNFNLKAFLNKALKLIQTIYKNTSTFLIKKPRILKAGISIITSVVIMLSVIAITGVVSALEISVNGVAIGCVKNENEVLAAKELAKDKISDENGKNIIENINSSPVVTGTANVKAAKYLVEPLLKNTKDIVNIAYIKVNDLYIGYSYSIDTLNEILESYLQNKKAELNAESAAFDASLETGEEYISLSGLNNLKEISDVSSLTEYNLPVVTETTYTENVVLQYETIREQTASLLKGDAKTKTEGINGEKTVTYKVSYLNGKEVSKTVINETITKSAINKVVLVGTKDPADYYKKVTASRAAASSKGFIWPLPRLENSYITAYYGDGRNHKGMDICAPSGTAIYAASGGTVELASFSGGYGLCVIINHGNGLKTRYAHCSKLFVSVGQTVSQGENIAAVGITGQATGPHLHFEVMINEQNVDPAPYILN